MVMCGNRAWIIGSDSLMLILCFEIINNFLMNYIHDGVSKKDGLDIGLM